MLIERRNTTWKGNWIERKLARDSTDESGLVIATRLSALTAYRSKARKKRAPNITTDEVLEMCKLSWIYNIDDEFQDEEEAVTDNNNMGNAGEKVVAMTD